MNGKELKVTEYNLTFGKTPRIVNVFGLFKYKKNNNLYVVYSDKGNEYSIVYYGGSHVKNNTILSMSANKEGDEKIIKEYISKITKKGELENFEILSLDKIDEIEIISSNKIEVKPEILNSLVELTIPKKKEDNSSNNIKKTTKNKKSPLKMLLILFVLVIIGLGAYMYLAISFPNEETSKVIKCKKVYEHETLNNVEVEYEKDFNFNNLDTLKSVNIDVLYRFSDENNYLDFINKGLYYTYMPDDIKTDGETFQNNEEYTFRLKTNELVDSSYDKPTNYEEVLSYYTNEGYTCDEDIEK